MIKENIDIVKNNIIKSANKSGRDISDVTLIAVSKTKPIEMLQEAYECGMRDFGENKVQEILDKYDKMPTDVRWHMIGHLQTNKVKYIIDKVYAIHSVDSIKLANEISKQAVKHNVSIRVLLEVNVAEEESKFGITSDEVINFAKEVASLPNIKVEGLMTVAPYVDDPELNRQYFVDLAQLSVDINNENIDNGYGNKLSMGMTNDYCIAIEEGATFVRVGTGIFGERNYQI